jgi:flagellar biosynthesis GTPase FlhF
VNVVVLNVQEEKWKAVEESSVQERSIDVWWWGDATSRLMLLFAFLITRNEEWDDARIRVLAPHSGGSATGSLEQLAQTLKDVRIQAEPELVEKASFEKVIEHSGKASIIFFPMRVRGTRLINPLGVPFDQLLSRLPLAALVIAAEDIDLEAEPEEGDLAEKAAARDAATDAETSAQKAEKEAAKAVGQAEEKMRDLQKALEKDPNRPERDEMERAAQEAKEKARMAVREAARARVEADQAAQTVRSIERKGNHQETE